MLGRKVTETIIRLNDVRTIVDEARRNNTIVTQDGIAAIFAVRHGGTLRYCHTAKRWYYFEIAMVLGTSKS